MGLLRRSTATADDAPLAEAEVLAMAPTARGARQTERRDVEYDLDLRVAGRDVRHTCRVPHDKTPLLGQRLPVVLGRDGDPATLRVAWDRAPSLTARMLQAGQAAGRGDSAAAARALGFTLRDDA